MQVFYHCFCSCHTFSYPFDSVHHWNTEKNHPPNFCWGEVGACRTESLGTSTKSRWLQPRPSLGCGSLCRSVRSWDGWCYCFKGTEGKGYGVMENGRLLLREVWGMEKNTLRELWMEEKSHLERTLVLMLILIVTSAWIYFRDFASSLPLKTQFVSWRCCSESLDFHPFNPRLMILFSFWIPFLAFAVFCCLTAQRNWRPIGPWYIPFAPKKMHCALYSNAKHFNTTFWSRRFPSLSKPRGAFFLCWERLPLEGFDRWEQGNNKKSPKRLRHSGHRLVK